MDLHFRINKRILSCKNATYVIADSVNADKCYFEFDTEWDELSKQAVFKNTNSDNTYKMILDSDNSCYIPHEVLIDTNKKAKLEVMALGTSVSGGVIEKKLTTSMTIPLFIKDALDSDSANESEEETASIAEQLLDKLDSLVLGDGGTVELSNYYKKTEVDTKLKDKSNVGHTHNASEISGLTSGGTVSDEQIAEAVDDYFASNSISSAKVSYNGQTVESTLDTTLENVEICMKDYDELTIKYNDLLNRLIALEGTGSVAVSLLSATQLIKNWRFYLVSSKSSTSYTSTEESTNSYDDSSWSTVSVPHDWSIYNSFNSKSSAGASGGYLDGGDAWYRRHLPITSDMAGKKVYIYFDGVYMESDVYINGTKVGFNKMGYNPFYVDISDYITVGQDNVLAVFVRNNQPSSRWYSGSGIYRNVTLLVGETQDVGISDIFVTTPNLETEAGGDVTTNVSVKLANNTSNTLSATLKVDIYNGAVKVGDNEATYDLAAGTITTDISVMVSNPDLWDIYNAHLYKARVSLTIGLKTYYREITFGYRYFAFDKDGFSLNGVSTKLKGVCMHHDFGCLGAEINKSAIERQLNTLIDMGCNAIRLTHNPSSTEYLDMCAQKGILLVEEFFDCWGYRKVAYDFARYFTAYAETVIKSTINRDKNNPAIIMWSLGNEIIRTSSYTTEEAVAVATDLKTWVNDIDTTRPVTMGEDRPTATVALAVMDVMDVIGINYGDDSEYHIVHSRKSDKCVYGSETTSAISSRGVYVHDATNLQCSSYDNDKVDWGAYAYDDLKRHMDSAYIAGMFVWTGFDYIGEPTPYSKYYPAKSSYFGIVDLAGYPKDIYYMYQSRWSTNPMIHILPKWEPDAETVAVWLYSNCYKVELLLNGVSLGSKLQTAIGDKYQFAYDVPYQRGTLVANGYDDNNNLIAQDIIYTSQGTPSSTKLYSDKTTVNINSDDLVFVACDIVDTNGVICPTASTKITFSAVGAEIVATDNGNAACVEDFRTATKSAFNGKVLCVLRHDGTSGNIVLTASGDGISNSTVTIKKGTSTVYSDYTSEFVDATSPTIYDYDFSCKGVTLDSDTLEFSDTTGQTLTATVIPFDTTDTVTWTSSNTNVAVVNNGVVTPIATGTCVITATCGNYSDTCNVSVTLDGETVSTTSISLDADTLTFTDSSTKTLTATVLPDNTTDILSWSSSDSTIASVANGVVTPHSNGSCTITATSGAFNATCAVTVVIEQSGETTPYTVSWDGTTETLPSEFSVTDMSTVLQDDGTYALTGSKSTSKILIADSAGDGELEMEVITSDYTSGIGWRCGVELCTSTGKRVVLFVSNTSNTIHVTDGNASYNSTGKTITNDVSSKLKIDALDAVYNIYVNDELVKTVSPSTDAATVTSGFYVTGSAWRILNVKYTKY